MLMNSVTNQKRWISIKWYGLDYVRRVFEIRLRKRLRRGAIPAAIQTWRRWCVTTSSRSRSFVPSCASRRTWPCNCVKWPPSSFSFSSSSCSTNRLWRAGDPAADPRASSTLPSAFLSKRPNATLRKYFPFFSTLSRWFFSVRDSIPFLILGLFDDWL